MFTRTILKLPQATQSTTTHFLAPQHDNNQRFLNTIFQQHLNHTHRRFLTTLKQSRGQATNQPQPRLATPAHTHQPLLTPTHLSRLNYSVFSHNRSASAQSKGGITTTRHRHATRLSPSHPSITPTRPRPVQHITRRNINFKPGKEFEGQNAQQQQGQDDLRRFAFKKPAQYNLSQNPNVNQANIPHTTLTGTRIPNPGPQTNGMNQTVKQHFFEDPNVPRWRKDLVLLQDFLSDSSRPPTLDTDKTLTRFGKKLIRGSLAPWRRLYKFSRWIAVKMFGANRIVLLSITLFVGSIVALFAGAFKALDRVNVALSRELFVRSTMVDLAARLDSYGLLSFEQTTPVLLTFKIYTDAKDDEGSTWYNDTSKKSAADQGFNGYRAPNPHALAYAQAPKNYKGQEMMKAFLMQAISLPIETSHILEALYDPKSRIDEVSEGINLVFLEKLADCDPSQANDKCPPHIRAIAGRVVEEWFRRTRFQMIEEKQRKLEAELKVEKIDDLTPAGRKQIKDKLEEYNTGITFDLTKREKRKLFWKGILTGVMLETGLIGLENETTFLRLARDYALKGCVLRQIPEKVKIADAEVPDLAVPGQQSSVDQALVTANPAGEFKFNSSEELVKIRDRLTQQPYHPDHGQSDARFFNFIFGREFCQEYGLTPDSSPYLHQIAPLALLDLANWTHPQSIFDLTHSHQPNKLQGSKYTLPPAEFEKVEMYNFMLDEMTKKDQAFAYLDKQYRQTSISKDELIVLPLTQPQDSLRNPTKYGLEAIESQVTLLEGRIPQCYQDTYGAYARTIFLFDMVILRNLLEIFRLKRSLGELGTSRIRDMTIPSASNYYGNYDRLLQGDLLDVIKQEQVLTESYRLRGVDFKREYDERIKTDLAQLNVRDPLSQSKKDKDGNATYKTPDDILIDQIDQDFKETRAETAKKRGATPADAHSVSVDAGLLKELSIKETRLSDLTPDGIMRMKEDKDRQRRAKRWVDNGSV